MISFVLNCINGVLFPPDLRVPLNPGTIERINTLEFEKSSRHIPDYALAILESKEFVEPREYGRIYGWVRLGMRTDDPVVIAKVLRGLRASPQRIREGEIYE
ncbi:hypothetical protein ABW19_dt0206757 [Dactylella cylindrospora]|nr:hypothetical protein ABW19_dt0206757 [Dactylella cylindrospora]